MWITVRLRVNHWRGLIGSIVEMPASIAAGLVCEGRADYTYRGVLVLMARLEDSECN